MKLLVAIVPVAPVMSSSRSFRVEGSCVGQIHCQIGVLRRM
jgi:hypothetical protein